MCDTRRASPTPRWGVLYGWLLVSFFSAAVVRVAAAASWRGVASWGIGVAAVTGVAQWIRWNQVALDQSEWCACASASVRIRTIPAAQEEDRREAEQREEEQRSATLVA